MMQPSIAGRAGEQWTLRKWVAGIAAGTLVAGTLVAVGIGANQAAAAGPAPEVSTTQQGSYIAGEDLELDLTFASGADSDQYNLGAGVVLPEGATVVDSGTLGSPTVYEAGAVLPGAIAPGTEPSTCEALGLESAPSGTCRVPEGKQYLVFQNISDLPEGASTTHTLTVRPDATEFPVGSEFPYQVNASTSGDERFLPVFPGSTGVMSEPAREATSNDGVDVDAVPVNALRIDKSEPSPEGELLRGVHQNSTTYTLRVWHTGEGDIGDVVVTDLLPAGLEYLGLGGIDNTANANGNRGDDPSLEYDGADRLTSTPAPADSGWGGDADHELSRNANTGGETVETVEIDGAVHTRVTWNVGELVAAGLADYSIVDPVEQEYSEIAGEAGFFEIRYRAAIPLFENTLDFDGSDGQPGTDGEQTANLDNNRGPSTRHGIDDDERNAKTYTNRAEVTGAYDGEEVDDDDTESVDAVDVRLLKTVDSGGDDSGVFTQGNNARYTLNIATSEYVSAELGGERPDRLVDDLANGICPVFPSGTEITPGAGPHESTPNFVIGDPNPGGDREAEGMTTDEWNSALGEAGVGESCGFPSNAATEDDALAGATLTGIAFDPVTGHFTLDLSLAEEALPAGLGEGHEVFYSAAQNTAYYGTGGSHHGATTSGDRVSNTAEIHATTTAIDAVSGLDNAGGHDAGTVEEAWDDSNATLEAQLSNLSKHVLQREAGVPAPDEVATAPDADDWVRKADTPFAIGDEVWYRVTITPPAGTDVRNPRFTDFLPRGVEFDPVDSSGNGRPDNIWVQPSSNQGLGSCDPTDRVDWLNTFVPFDGTNVNGNVLTFNLGSSDCVSSSDRFLPVNTELTIYIKGTVTDQSAFGEVDLAQNLAKYQQENVEGDIFFLRDDAEVTLAQDLNLVKGVRDINGAPSGGNAFGSDVDHQQVVQGDRVTYRLDVTAPQVDSTGYTVWDALPEGITAADINTGSSTAGLIEDGDETGAVDSGGWTANVYDSDDYPADVAQHLRQSVQDEGRSIIVWTIDETVPGSTAGNDDADPAVPAVTRGLSLGYTLVVPDGAAGGPAAQLTQEYHNDASIVQYSAVSNGEGNTPLVPEGDGTLSTREADGDAGEYPVPSEGTHDPSDVFLPNAEMEKTLLSTEIGPNSAPNPPGGENDLDPNNPDNAIVQGEYATFEYSAAIPGNTTVHGAKLRDSTLLTWTGNPANGGSRELSYHFLDGSAEATYPDGLDTSGFTLHQQDSGEVPGTLVFPDEYTNSTDEDQVFSVQITVWVDDRDASNPDRDPDFPNNKQLTNTAEFEFASPADGTSPVTLDDTANVQYREPNLEVEKSAGPKNDVQAGQEIEYTLTVTNPNRVKSYDNTVVDTVPAGLIVDTAQDALSGATFQGDDGDDTAASLNAGSGGVIRWSFEAFDALEEIPNTATLSYTAEIDPTTGAGRGYENTAEATGHTLPSSLPNAEERRGDRKNADSETVTATTADINKGVRAAGSSGDYGASASAPIGDRAEYQVDVTLRGNINYYAPQVADHLPAGVVLDESTISGPQEIDENGDPVPGGISGGDWSYDSGAHTWAHHGDIESAPADRVLRITYTVDLTGSVENDITNLPNTARFTWGTTADDDDRRSVDDEAVVTVLDPVLDIDKTVEGGKSFTGNPSEGFDYRFEVTNRGETPAFHVTVTDDVPAGVIVDAESITPTPSSVDPGVSDGTGGTIAWEDLAGPLPVYTGGEDAAETLGFEYSATFAPSGQLSADDFPYANVASVTHFESFPRDDEGNPTGREYDPDDVNSEAEVTPIFPDVELTKDVADGDMAYVDEPFGWQLTLVNTGEGDAQEIGVTDLLPANWEYDAGTARISVGGADFADLDDPAVTPSGDLPVGGEQQLDWSAAQIVGGATPILPGTESNAAESARTIVITFSATPNEHALEEAGVGMTVNHTNTFRAAVTDTAGADENGDGPYVGEEDTADAHIAAADLQISKTGVSDPIMAGETGALGWSITVTNNGPDTAEGSITVTDTTDPLPEGIEVTSVSGDGWTCEPPEMGEDRVVGFACERTDTADSLDNGDSFDPIRVFVDAAGDVTAHTEASNTAAVDPGRTHDDDPSNNEDDATITTDAQADLAIEKSVNTASPNAGAELTWQLDVRNLGPSASVSTEDEPITIADVIPEGVNGVADPSTDEWRATAPGGFPANSGDTITWTFQGASIAANPDPEAPPAFEMLLTGTIDADWREGSGPAGDGSILNTAVLTPGVTEDPEEPNNEDEVTITPGDATSIGIAKTRVVQIDGTWVPAASLDPVPPFQPGDDVSYRITVVNYGSADARDVTVVDETPAGLGYEGHENEAGTWGHTPGGTNDAGESNDRWGTFALDGTQQVGEENSRSFVVTYSSDSGMDPEEELVNWVEASATNTPDRPRDSDSSERERSADLSVEKTHLGEAVSGSTLGYELVVTNNGPSDSSAPIDVRDVLPADFAYVPGSATVNGAPAEPGIDGQELSWADITAGADLARGGTVTIAFDASIAADAPAQEGLVNNAWVSGPEDDDPGNNHDDDEVDLTTHAVMTIAKDVEPGPWVAGTEVTYTLTMHNQGPSAAPASVTDTLPAGLTMVSMDSSTGWDCDADIDGSQSGTCVYAANDGLHPVGETTTIEVTAFVASSVPVGTGLENIAELEWSDSRGTHEDDDAASIEVTTQADLVLQKTAIDESGDEIDRAVAGEETRYRIEVRNDGPSDAIAPLTVTDTLPDGASFVGLSDGASAAWSASVDGDDPQRVTFTRTPTGTGIAEGVTAPAIVFDALVDHSAADGEALVNTAVVQSGTPETDESNNTDTAEVSVDREVDVAIAKSHDAGSVRIGDELAFTLDVVNHGPSTASEVRVTDTVPSGLTVTSVPEDLGNGWAIDEVTVNDDGTTTVLASYAHELAPGETAEPLVLRTEVTAAAYETVTNTAEVEVAEEERDPGNNRAEDVVTVPPMSTLIVNKQAIGKFQVGEIGTYKITLKNLGPTAAPGPITVTDALPRGLTFASSPDHVSVRGNTVTWTLADGLAAGKSVTFTLDVNVQRAAHPTLTNTVTVGSPTEQTNDAQLTDSDTVEIAEADGLVLTGGDVLALWILLALLLALAGAATLMRRLTASRRSVSA